MRKYKIDKYYIYGGKPKKQYAVLKIEKTKRYMIKGDFDTHKEAKRYIKKRRRKDE